MWMLIAMARDETVRVSQLVDVVRRGLLDTGIEIPDVTHPPSVGTGPFVSSAVGARGGLDVEWSPKIGHEKDVYGASRKIILRARWGSSTLETTTVEVGDPESCGPVSAVQLCSPYALRMSLEADEAFAKRLAARLAEDGWRVTPWDGSNSGSSP